MRVPTVICERYVFEMMCEFFPNTIIVLRRSGSNCLFPKTLVTSDTLKYLFPIHWLVH